MVHVFSRGIATGEAFCNRKEELLQLTKNIEKFTHTFIISPRRYGKTSLALKAIATSKRPYAHIDLFMKCDNNSVLHEFYEGIAALLSQVTKPSEKAIKLVERFFKNMKISLSLGKVGLEFSLSPVQKNEQLNFKQLLIGLDEFLVKNNQKVVIFVDEIQSIAETELFNEVESALRFIAQKTQQISFIFSGSSRHLLSIIFEDKNRPFYKLCQKMTLERITSAHYELFINRFAMKKWKKKFSKEALDAIFKYTELHPYYVNILCDVLFDSAQLPTEGMIQNAWHDICMEEQSSIARDVEFLTLKQRKLLIEIANQSNLTEVNSMDFIKKVGMTARGINLGINTLSRHDLIERNIIGEFRVIDPVLAYWLRLSR